MDYHGFRSLKEYENECARLGFTTRRVPFHKDGEVYFALVITPPGHPTGTSVETWTLFSADSSAQVLDGIVSSGVMSSDAYLQDGLDVNYIGKLAASGYYPGDLQKTSVITAPEYPDTADGQISFLL